MLNAKALDAAIDAGIKAKDLYELTKDDVLTRGALKQFATAAIEHYLTAAPASDGSGKI